ncbi:hypothetical protein A4D02_14955 [Niastella koreensis]|uniref:Uncharacterized protein n=1 Tax=Niastella koreensis TaxID=354356 RepID=A0ABX3NRU4_9BACT|nr:hypothetical protein A4D02_14955 [Niastella koreensis]
MQEPAPGRPGTGGNLMQIKQNGRYKRKKLIFFAGSLDEVLKIFSYCRFLHVGTLNKVNL